MLRWITFKLSFCYSVKLTIVHVTLDNKVRWTYRLCWSTLLLSISYSTWCQWGTRKNWNLGICFGTFLTTSWYLWKIHIHLLVVHTWCLPECDKCKTNYICCFYDTPNNSRKSGITIVPLWETWPSCCRYGRKYGNSWRRIVFYLKTDIFSLHFSFFLFFFPFPPTYLFN